MIARFLLPLIGLGLPAAALAATIDKGLPASGTIITLTPTLKGYEASFDVGLDDAYTKLEVTTEDSALKGGAPKLMPEVVKSAAAPEKVKRVVLRLEGAGYRLAPYSMTVVAEHVVEKAKKKVKEKVERDLWLQVPAATLDTPDTLIVTRVCGVLMFHGSCWPGEQVTSNDPPLWESTRRGWLTGITVQQKAPTAPAERAIPGTLQAGDKIGDISPGVSQRLVRGTHYNLDGEFPLGVSKGKLLVQAEQLSTPATLDFEIHTRASKLLLIFGLALGLLLGILTRRILKRRLDVHQEKQKTFALLELVTSAETKTADEKVRSEIRELRMKLNGATVSKSIEDVKKLTSEVQTAFLAQQDVERARRAKIDQAYAAAVGLLRAPWKVSETLKAALATARTALETEIAQNRPSNNYTQEEQTLDNALAGLVQTAHPQVTQHARDKAAVDGAVGTLKPLMNPIGASVLDALVKPPDAPKTDPLPKPEDMASVLHSALEFLHLSRSYVGEMVQNSRLLLDAQFTAWERLVSRSNLRDAAAWRKWISTARQFATNLGGVSLDDSESVAALATATTALITELKQSLLSQARTQVERESLKTKLDENGFADAVTLVEEMSRPAPEAVAVPESGVFEDRGIVRSFRPLLHTDSARAPDTQTHILMARSRSDLPSIQDPVFSTAPPDTTSAAMLAALSRRSLETTGVLLSAIYGAVILVGGYFLLEAKWVGTPLDFAIAFFWAYATDIGADAATTVAKGLK